MQTNFDSMRGNNEVCFENVGDLFISFQSSNSFLKLFSVVQVSSARVFIVLLLILPKLRSVSSSWGNLKEVFGG